MDYLARYEKYTLRCKNKGRRNYKLTVYDFMDGIKHIITEADLENNPALGEVGIAVGEEITIPAEAVVRAAKNTDEDESEEEDDQVGE